MSGFGLTSTTNGIFVCIDAQVDARVIAAVKGAVGAEARSSSMLARSASETTGCMMTGMAFHSGLSGTHLLSQVTI